jgi:hypothetical protein
MEPEVSLPYSQKPVTGPYPEPDKSSPQSPLPIAWVVRNNLLMSEAIEGVIANISIWTTRKDPVPSAN